MTTMETAVSEATDEDRDLALLRAVATTAIAHADELTALDQAIGDGDHGLNMKRGFQAVLADLPALAPLRGTLRERLEASPLCDGPGFTRGLEAAYRDMWRGWCERP